MHPSAPHSALQLHKPALPRAPLQHVQQKCPQACRTLPSPHTACQRKATKQPLATVPPFFIYMLGSSIISTGSADVIPGIHLAQCGPSHSQLKRRKEVAYSQPKEEFINFPPITRCYGQGKMHQAHEELRGGCEEAPPGEEASPGEEAATQPQALKESGGRPVTGTWAQGQSQERRAGL